jgi:2-amino-4-hydroxy-6-hydroxymethyldihydropteridine diphosphokinase
LSNGVVIALGANLDHPLDTFNRAIHLMDGSGIRTRKRSRLYRTRPWGLIDQPDFLNAAVLVDCRKRPLDLLALLLGIEQNMGRRRVLHWGPRRIDLDLVLFGSLRMNHPQLQLPHPGIAERDFVLAPLLDLNVPVVPGIARFGWRHLLNHLPRNSRTILSSSLWK